MLPVRRALVSVSDKQGLPELARGLDGLDVEILSTGGTARFLEEIGVPVTPVSDVTGFPEILGGRVKTLHPHIHGGILADRGQGSHLKELQQHGIAPIDLVVVNLYPFQETAETEGATDEEVVEMIDIGGPTMIRAAAKNLRGVAVVVDPADYPQVLAALESADRTIPEPVRRGLAIKAFRHTQAYDAAIASWLARQSGEEQNRFRRHLLVNLLQEGRLRYGENPHQAGAVYRIQGERVFGGMEQLQGKELSWNNLLDVDAARRLLAFFEDPTVVIVKHNNPCGVGRAERLSDAYERALACDPASAFGSVIAVNRPVDGPLAEAMEELFVEVLVAPDFDQASRRRLAAKKNLRLLCCPPYRAAPGAVDLRAIEGGFLAQVPDADSDDAETWSCPTKRAPTDEERRALAFAWRVVRGVRSNAIVVANGEQTVGIGAGQMSRVDSCRLAVEKARLPVGGAAAASDAFFPFRDGVDVLAEAGVSAIVQPGGSKRDDEVVAAADERGLAMLMTGRRHFRH